jgi:hypothetical protein
MAVDVVKSNKVSNGRIHFEEYHESTFSASLILASGLIHWACSELTGNLKFGYACVNILEMRVVCH